MKKTDVLFFKMLSIFLLIIAATTSNYGQQYIVNSEWSFSFPTNDTSNYYYKKVTVKTDAASNVYTLGSSINSTGHDFLLMKQNDKGDTLFISNWNGDGNGEDIAMDMWVDNNTEYVYVVGGSVQNGTDSLDAVLVIFNDMGFIPYYTYSSNSGSYNDIFTSLASDGSTYMYAVGSMGTATQGYDYLVTQFDLSANEINSDTYDNGYDDIAVKVILDSDDMFVAGMSETNDTTWDYYLRQYKAPLLAYTGDYRNYSGTGQLHQATDAVFSNGYYYVTGGIFNGTDYDMKTVKLDTTLTVIWEQTWDGNFNDISRSMKVDADGNVYITGTTFVSLGNSNLVTIKYDASGNEQFVRFVGENTGVDAAYDLELYGNNVYITGNLSTIANGNVFTTICYDTAGNFRWNKLGALGANYPTDMAIDGNGDIVIACPLTSALYTEKYSTLILANSAVQDSSNTPLFVGNQVLVKFNPDVVKQSAVNRKGKIFGRINDFIQDSTIAKLDSLFGFSLVKNDSVRLIKVYRSMTVADSISIGRSGHEVQVPKFWSMFIMTLPATVSIDSILLDTLESVFPDVYYAIFNSTYQLLGGANDAEYYEQGCFHPTIQYPNGHINMEPAWDREVGSSQLRIGVYDSGIYYHHPDFGGGLGNGAVGGGYDFVEDYPMGYGPVSPDDQGHGTACAGLIGAVRNNNIGIAGAAGGNDSLGIDGVKLYAMKIYNDDNEWISAADQFNAWFIGASSFGYNLNGMSLSYGQQSSSNYALHEAMRYVYDNDVFFACARGNAPSVTDNVVMPACEKDEFVINVGGSGWDGNLKGINNNTDPVISQDVNTLSMFGQGVDVIAPATTALVRSLSNSSGNDYVYFNGTSAATPIVAGVAGLMISNYNGQLFPEDVEYFLERFASDKSDPGYDDSTGWGLLNAGAIMDSIYRPKFDVLHFNYSTQPLTSISTNAGYGIWVHFANNYYGITQGDYIADWYKLTVTINHNLPSGASIIDAWPRNSDSKGWESSNFFHNYDTEVILDTVTPTYAVMHTYFYYLQSFWNGALYPVNRWVPGDPGVLSNRQFAYSVYVANPTAGLEEQENDMSFNVYPNPSDDHVNILFKFDTDRQAGFKLYDMAGRILLSTSEIQYSAGDNLSQIDVSGLSAGIYILQMNSGNMSVQKKIVVK